MTKLWVVWIAAMFVSLELAPASADPCPGSDDTCPTQQYAVAGGATEVTVKWVEAETLPAYFVVSRSQSGATFAAIGRQTTGNPNDWETYADYTVQPNTGYVYQICGWYSAAQQACVTTNAVTTPPAPSDTATPPPSITQASATSTSIAMSWNGNTTYEFYNVSQVLLSEQGIEQPSLKVPHPTIGGAFGAPGILSQPTFTGFRRPASSAGLGGGFVNVAVSGTNWSIADSAAGVGAYSVQLNTNQFSASCHSSAYSALSAALAIVGAQNCVAGDNAAVQFTYQTYNAGRSSLICVWNVDVTRQWYYFPATWQVCQNVGPPGFWQASQTLNVSGSVDFANHLLTTIVALPWAAEWDSAVAPDWYGLCWTPGPVGPQCAWNQNSGTILGSGNGSQAVFSPEVSVQTIVGASASCVIGGCFPQKLPVISIANPYKGALATGRGTVETNNLSTYYFGAQPPAVCSGIACTLTYTASSSAPQ